MSILVDTSVVIRLFDRRSAEHLRSIQALRILRQRGERACSSAQVVIESWVVMTRPLNVRGLGLSLTEANANVDRIVRLLPPLAEPVDVLNRWRELVVLHNVSGKPAHDARLVAVMLAHGVNRILTHNVADFARYAEITPITPAEITVTP